MRVSLASARVLPHIPRKDRTIPDLIGKSGKGPIGMSHARSRQQALPLQSSSKQDVRTQFGALCWRTHKDKTQVLLVTSRGTGRWIIPKGWPMDGATPAEAARQEAWEEAGATGRVSPVCLGVYSYAKRQEDGTDLPCVVAVFPLKVKKLSDDFPEADDRRRKWCGPKKAASLVDEPELSQLLRRFDPRAIRDAD